MPSEGFRRMRRWARDVPTTDGATHVASPSVGATLKSEGSGYELYETTHYQDLDVYHSETLSHTLDQIANGNTTLVRRDLEKIDLTGQLQNDQPVWTGTAYREVKGNLNYKDHFDAKYALGAYNKRDAELTKTATYRSDFDPVTRQIVNTGSNNGAQVAITGDEAMCNGCLFGGGELVVTPHTTLTDYEAAIQAIFEDWDGSEVILPPDELPPPPEPDPEPPTTPPPSPPASSESVLDGLARWFGGSNGDGLDEAMFAVDSFHSGWWESYKDYVNPWDGGQEPVDAMDTILAYATPFFQAGGAIAGVAASGIWLWGAAGGSTIGFAWTPHVSGVGTNVSFQVAGTWFRGTAEGLIRFPTGWFTPGKWQYITGIPILNSTAASSVGPPWIFSQHPCVSAALQAFLKAWGL